jgi:GAF domain-containing protein
MSTFHDSQALTRVLAEFARTLASRYEVSDVLHSLAEHIVEILDAAGTGVSLVDAEGRLRTVTGVNELSSRLEASEEELQEGPCVDAFREGRVLRVPDLSQSGSWPRWQGAAREQGIRAVLAVPLHVCEQPVGAVNVYSAEPREWPDEEVSAARVLADMAASYVVNASELAESRRTTEQLREALESRIVIEQAKGILANELGCTVDQAFVVLRNHARRNSAGLRSVAHAVVHLGLRPSRRGAES